jgi:polyhydroxyalkanoate synthase
LRDIAAGQLTQTKPGAFEVGRNLATTPGKVIKETALYQLIHYTPTTDEVLRTPVVIFPPWINRFYVLDLTPEKSFVKWCVDQGIQPVHGQLEVGRREHRRRDARRLCAQGPGRCVDTVSDLLGVEERPHHGYCVAGTTLAATLATFRRRSRRTRSSRRPSSPPRSTSPRPATSSCSSGDEVMTMLEQISRDSGVVDGRYMAATFNLLRGPRPHLELCGQQLPDGATSRRRSTCCTGTATPPTCPRAGTAIISRPLQGEQAGRKRRDQGRRHRDRYRPSEDPDLRPGRREDHIAPPQSVWKIMDHFAGPKRFVLAGSGHIAGVVNPPAAQKYCYWVNDRPGATLDEFIQGATEHKGSWWPDWLDWLKAQDSETVKATGARIPGKGKLKAIEDAPGSYVRAR